MHEELKKKYTIVMQKCSKLLHKTGSIQVKLYFISSCNRVLLV